MRMVRHILPGAIACATAAMVLAETRPMDTYQSIVVRNPFGLKDPPPKVEAPPPPGPTNKPTEFYLTGISTIGFPKKPKKAYLVNKDASKKEYTDKYFNLTLGVRDGDMLLQEVDEKSRRVKIAYRGEEMWLSMKDNGVPAPTGPAPAPPGGIPGQPGQPGVMIPSQPGVPHPGMATPLPNSGGLSSPAQPVLYPNANNPNRRIPRSSMNNGALNNPYGAPNTTYAAPAYNNNPSISVGNINGAVPGSPEAQAANAANNAANLGPQTDAELIEHIARTQNQEKFGNLPPGVPIPPVPKFGP